ncbi:hypothetical protein [Fervidobacterium sp.]
MKKAIPIITAALLLGAQALAFGTQEEQEIARSIEQFMQQYDPSRTYGPPSSSGSYNTSGTDLLSLFIQAYNLARNFFRGLPPLYLRGVSNVHDIRNRILDQGTTEITIVSGQVGRLPSLVVQSLEERVFIPDRTYPNLKLNWAMPQKDLERYRTWETRQDLRATLNLVPRGQDLSMEVFGVAEAIGFGFMMINSDLYLFTPYGQFFQVDPGPAGAFIPWIRLVANQLGDAKRRSQ